VLTPFQLLAARLIARLAAASVATCLVPVLTARKKFSAFQIACNILRKAGNLVKVLMPSSAGFRDQYCTRRARACVASAQVPVATTELFVAQSVTCRQKRAALEGGIQDGFSATATYGFSDNDLTSLAVTQMMDFVASMRAAVQ